MNKFIVMVVTIRVTSKPSMYILYQMLAAKGPITNLVIPSSPGTDYFLLNYPGTLAIIIYVSNTTLPASYS